MTTPTRANGPVKNENVNIQQRLIAFSLFQCSDNYPYYALNLLVHNLSLVCPIYGLKSKIAAYFLMFLLESLSRGWNLHLHFLHQQFEIIFPCFFAGKQMQCDKITLIFNALGTPSWHNWRLFYFPPISDTWRTPCLTIYNRKWIYVSMCLS